VNESFVPNTKQAYDYDLGRGDSRDFAGSSKDLSKGSPSAWIDRCPDDAEW